MNIIFLIPLLLLLAICVNYKFNYNVNINKYSYILLPIIILIIIVNELKFTNKNLEDFVSYPLIKKDYLDEKKQIYLNNKQFYKPKTDNLFEYQDLKIVTHELYQLSKKNNILYLSSNILHPNSRIILRYKVNPKNIEENMWINALEMNDLYLLPSLEHVNNNNNKYYSTNIILNNIIFFAGGVDKEIKNFNPYITIWDMEWDNWKNLDFPSKEPRAYISSYVNNYDNTIYLAGGYKNGKYPKMFSDKVDIYNIDKGHYTDSNAWTHETLPSGGRINIKISSIKNKVFFSSGYNTKVIDTIDIYNPNIDGYKWTVIKLPKLLIDITLNTSNFGDKIIFSKKLNYNHNLFLDSNIYLNFNNKKIYERNLKTNKIVLKNYVLNQNEYNGKYGTAYKIGDWINKLHKKFNNNMFNSESIDTWVFINKKSKELQWIFGNGNFYRKVLGVVVMNNKLYPTVKIDSKVYRFTKGIEFSDSVWNHINLSVNKEGNAKFFVNHDVIEFKINFKLDVNLPNNGIDLSEGYLLHNELTNFWVDGYISYISFLSESINYIEYHNLHISNLNRFSEKVTEMNTKYNKDEFDYYNKKYDSSQILIYSKNKFIPYDQFFPLCRKLYDNFNSVYIDSQYLIFYGNSVNEHNFKVSIKPVIFIYNIVDELWYEKKLDFPITTNIKTFKDNILLISGVEDEDIVKPVIFTLKFPKNIVEKVVLPKEKPALCVPGQKKIKNKCIDCGINEYSKFHNSNTCNKCPPFTNTNNKKKQTECVYDNIFDFPKKINIRNNTQVVINKEMDKYNEQLSKNKQFDLIINSKNNQINKVIEKYKKTFEQ